ncbi:tetratricopeptide repeat protein [Dactylosporangium sp. CA-092794]|uniref:tetratricopeptide repeat protein n=1 Tax=Dactylosporangium sp. CA-092794 TaxID=3239929 RepID=UPI003D8E3194
MLGGLTDYAEADLPTRDQLSSAASLWVGIASLLVSVVGPMVQVRYERRAALAASMGSTGGPPPPAGMASLDIPYAMAAQDVHGRDALIAELTDLYRWRARHRLRIHVLHGMGGSGKTTVALQAAHRLQKAGVIVWWVSAADATDLRTGLRQVTTRLGATAQELDRDWADNAPDVLWRRLMECPGRWLLVIDNADDPRMLAPDGETVAAQRGWIRPFSTRRGAIVVTTRDGDPRTWGAWCQLRHVGTLSTVDGAQVLLSHAGSRAGTAAQAAALATRLGGLPLALGLAGRYIADSWPPLPGSIGTFAAYQAALDVDGASAVFIDPGGTLSPNQARAVIARTWELSLDLLDERGLAQARPLLRLLSLLADAPIPYPLILHPMMFAASPLFAQIDAARLHGLLHALSTLGLLDLDNTSTDGADPTSTPTMATLRLHLLIRDTSRHHLEVSGDTAASLTLATGLLERATADAGPPRDPTTWPRWRALSPHCFHLMALVSAQSNSNAQMTVQAATAALRAARYLAETGLYTAALTQATTILDTVQRVLGAEHPAVLQARHDVALFTGRAGDAVAARDQYAALLPIRERVLGAEHPDTLSTRHTLASWTGNAGDAVAARDQYAALLSIRERILGAEHPDTLATRHNLARETGNAGDAVAARDQFAALLQLFEQVPGAEHPNTLATRHNLARETGNAGDAVAARDQFAALLPLYERILGAEHPETLATRHNLAWATGNAGDAVAARDQFAALLSIRERVLGAEHPDTLATRHNLARETGNAGDAVAARDQFAALLSIRERVLGAEHPDTLATRHNLARATGNAGDAVAARDQFAALLPIRERVLGAEHPDTLDTRHNLAYWTRRVTPS